ncbi:MAG: hypothetical protein B7X04_01695 [Parcubacteria group bacterium 21-54-25]|nr:MAG: hypothetical protein B7X04_01695 [Parcubacteria group bacterium 21-54-25]HQU07711.1 hypothetical protein [Candidatus Paceibacterota bacterium]
MVSGSTTSINIEYFFRLLYDAVTGAHVPGGTNALLFSVWQIIIVLGYFAALVALFILVYSLMRLYDVRRQEVTIYGPLPVVQERNVLTNPRWLHIQDLIGSDNSNDWRQAIIEADIMLGDMLTRQGYQAESIGGQLKQVEPSDFDTLNDAWEAHKVRNEIAHAGSAFVLSDTLAKRTIAHYGNVFHEFEMI